MAGGLSGRPDTQLMDRLTLVEPTYHNGSARPLCLVLMALVSWGEWRVLAQRNPDLPSRAG